MSVVEGRTDLALTRPQVENDPNRTSDLYGAS